MEFIDYFDHLRENDDLDYEKTLKSSGFWGKSSGDKIVAAGCVFISLLTGRILLGRRSAQVQEPNTWGGFGGAADITQNGELEDPIETVRREVAEEVGAFNLSKVIKFAPSYVYRKETRNGKIFEYHNFLAFVKDEFNPKLNWENSESEWFEYGYWPQPLHFGFTDLIEREGNKIQKILKNIKMSNPQLNEEKFTSNQLDMNRAYNLFKGSYEKATGQAWTFDKFASRARSWTFYGDEKGFVAVRMQRSNMVKLVGVAGNTKSIIRGFHELTADASGKPVWGAVSLEIGNMIAKLNPDYKVLKIPGGFIGSMLFNTIKTVIPAMVFGGAKIMGSKPDGSITFMYPDIGETNKVLIGNKEYFDYLRSQILILPNVSSLIKSRISKII